MEGSCQEALASSFIEELAELEGHVRNFGCSFVLSLGRETRCRIILRTGYY